MQKRTTLRPKSRRQVSPTRQDSGLIAKTKKRSSDQQGRSLLLTIALIERRGNGNCGHCWFVV
jgi:hypothetical protein